ncbi:hypothetical protein GCM10022223_14160 [Kineosporia mesophila]|uniref:Uncharacterized protein n=1 Tax=Kineosporia mesophila TaxID=566012 RepID=A0ABP6Z6Y1_9ACTN
MSTSLSGGATQHQGSIQTRHDRQQPGNHGERGNSRNRSGTPTLTDALVPLMRNGSKPVAAFGQDGEIDTKKLSAYRRGRAPDPLRFLFRRKAGLAKSLLSKLSQGPVYTPVGLPW